MKISLRPNLVNALLVIGGLVAGIVAVEMIVRGGMDPYACDTQLGWRFKGDDLSIKLPRSRGAVRVVRTNEQGFHDISRSYAETDDAFRILVLGDSMIAGTQVPTSNTFTQLLETRLGAASLPGRTIEVINSGVDGYGTAQELVLFRNIAEEYRPQLVLLGVFPFNDIADNHPGAGSWNHFVAYRCGRPYFEERDGELVAVSEGGMRPQIESTVERFLRLSRVYSSLKPVPTGAANPSEFRQGQIYDEDPPVGVEQGWELTKRLILEMRREVEGRGLHFAVIMVPARGELRDAGDLGQTGDRPASRPQRLLEEFLLSSGLSYINLLPEMSKGVGGEGTGAYLANDMHWNEEGHARVAGVIEDWVMKHCSALGVPIAGCQVD